MDFGYALNALREGLRVVRPGWENGKFLYLQLATGKEVILKSENYEPSQDDSLAEDWEVKS